MLDEMEAGQLPIESADTDLSLVSKWERFFQATEYVQKVREVADLYPDVSSITVAYSDLDNFDDDLAAYLLQDPRIAITAAQHAVHNLMHQEKRKAEISIRVNKLPRDAKMSIRDLRGRTLSTLVSFEALVTRVQQVKNNVLVGAFQCLRCGHIVKHDMEPGKYSEPFECYKEQEGCGRSSGTTRFRFLPDDPATKTEDVQKVECQEPLEDNRGGTSPSRITVWLSGDIAGSVTAGDRVSVNGIPRMVMTSPKSSIMDNEVDAVSVEFQDKEFADIEISEEDAAEFEREVKDPGLYKTLIGSIAPSIKGHDKIKEGLLLQLFGGWPKDLDDGSRLRGDIHILLVGDPGVAKSAMLRYMSSLAPRGVFASGKSSTAAGLTVAATKDAEWGEGRWTLEAGAMVLADGGFLAVDELDKMREEDRSAMHEGMEQQFIHVSKAGITATLPTRCSILGAANPKYSRFESSRYLSEQIDLAPTLLSRFDLIFVIQDIPNKNNDAEIARHILNAHARGGALANRHEGGMEKILNETVDMVPPYPPEKLRKLAAYAKRRRPTLSSPAKKLIGDHYVKIRGQGEGDGTVPITPRQLEGYVRLAEASARTRLSWWVEETDAKRAISLVEYYLSKLAGSGSDMEFDKIYGTPKKERTKEFVVTDIIKAAGLDGIKLSEVEELADAKEIPPNEVREIVKKGKARDEIVEVDPELGLLRWKGRTN